MTCQTPGCDRPTVQHHQHCSRCRGEEIHKRIEATLAGKQKTLVELVADDITAAIRRHREDWHVGAFNPQRGSFRIDLPAADGTVDTVRVKVGNERRPPQCDHCRLGWEAGVFEWMVHNELWSFVVPGRKGLLHLHCFEEKLGRRVQPRDLASANINNALRAGLNMALSYEPVVIQGAVVEEEKV